jgi:hypothetical protein
MQQALVDRRQHMQQALADRRQHMQQALADRRERMQQALAEPRQRLEDTLADGQRRWRDGAPRRQALRTRLEEGAVDAADRVIGWATTLLKGRPRADL